MERDTHTRTRHLSRVYLIIVTLIAASLVTGCISQTPAGNVDAQSFTIVDSLGRTVSIPEEPERIVSLAPGNTEILFALGLGDRVVGVTEYCNYPAEAQTRELVGGFSTISKEKVIALNPDLVLATGGIQEPLVNELEALGIAVAAFDAATVDDVLGIISLVGTIAGINETAAAYTASLEQRLDAVAVTLAQAVDTPDVFYIVWGDPLMSAGPNTFTHDIVMRAGGANIAAGTSDDYPVYNMEALIAADPSIIIISTHTPVTAAGILADPLWQNITAVENGAVYEIDADIVSRPGPRLVDAVEVMAQYIHPALFEQS